MILDSFRLDGKVALVTGASAGLGAAIAVALAEAGADVACHGNSRTPDMTCEKIAQLGRRTIPVFGDLSMREAPPKLLEATVKELGPPDILINNAGTIRRGAAASYSEDDWDAVIEINLTSVFRLSQLAGRLMIEHCKYRIGALISGRYLCAGLFGVEGRVSADHKGTVK